VVLTIFVNPLQFGAGEDLAAYPRDLDADLALALDEGVDIVFAPSVNEMYPRAMLTSVHVDALTDGLCGASRPDHFDGVTTVVAKLFAVAGPSRAYFGRKDFQQLATVIRMTEDLELPVEVVGCPIVREDDGLAMSSRNAYLDPEQRRAAAILSASLREGAAAVAGGERDAAAVIDVIRRTVSAVGAVELEYVEVRDARDLEVVTRLDGEVLVALAARVGRTRLIDNCTLDVSDRGVVADLGTNVERSREESEATCDAG
jgi:pantoate--beta-alanine ligase